MKKKKSLAKRILTVMLIIVGLVVLLFAGYVAHMLGLFNSANGKAYDLDNVAVLEESPIEGYQIIYLGSSVTQGMQSKNISFVEYIAKRNTTTYIKEAVSGTTLVDEGDESYIKRMLTIDTSYDADVFVCQLSTNDATKGYPLGEISDSTELSDFDTSTITGSIEYIIKYASDTWGAPVVFYTGSYYDSEAYDAMVSRLYEIQAKWGIGIIDLWNDEDMLEIDPELKDYYMNDGTIHPTRAGYLEWWTPKMEEVLYQY
jgi:lysophospholipase L1-like esterase